MVVPGSDSRVTCHGACAQDSHTLCRQLFISDLRNVKFRGVANQGHLILHWLSKATIIAQKKVGFKSPLNSRKKSHLTLIFGGRLDKVILD